MKVLKVHEVLNYTDLGYNAQIKWIAFMIILMRWCNYIFNTINRI